MKLAALLALTLTGCASGPLPWVQGPQQDAGECTASCAAHFAQCPQIFAAFPARGAVECPAARDTCLRGCARHSETSGAPVSAVALPLPAALPPPNLPPVNAPLRPVPASNLPTAASKEAKLRELKRWYEEGLVSEDIYKEQQRTILAQP